MHRTLNNRPLSTAAEDCLLRIQRMSELQTAASTSSLARELNVTDSTVTAMVQKLVRLKLVYHPQKREIGLTPSGIQLALRLIRRHRLIETYLHEFLGYSWHELHEEAERLEHAVSDHFIEAINERLGDPDSDPHGDPIPDRKGHIANRKLIRLSDAAAGAKGRIARVTNGRADLLIYLTELGIKLGAKVDVLDVPTHDSVVHLHVLKKNVTIGKSVAAEIFIDIT
jgi:DtxR family transcriptional regulator, Mn-dependent transcriptional regulator